MKQLPFWLSFLLIFFPLIIYAQNRGSLVRPKIGLTLSGGGAKGLAHIGILEAIDSAGLKVDYITGTSMGSIIGGLYAAGYSGDEIERIARGINWDELLSNQSSFRRITMEEKEEYEKYDIELPWVNNWFRLRTGVLEGEELWLKFAELFFPLYNVKDFNHFPIPFRCLATDISSGQAVVLDSGNIASAIRASMAIPSVFTAVDYDGKKLVDGGVIRNFPVRDVKEMGADVIIGSNVSNGLLASDKVNNALQVLLQIAFFREAEDNKAEVPLCTIYVSMPLPDYSMASFGESDKILEAGLEEGRKLYPTLKRLTDSLNNLYGSIPIEKNRLPAVKNVKISSYQVKGLHKTTTDYFIDKMDLLTGHYYTAQSLSRLVRKAFGTRYYDRISYSLDQQPDSSCKIIFDVKEAPLTSAKIGLNYNSFSGISAILNLTTRDFITPNSRSLVTVNVGQNFRFRAEHLQFFSRTSNFNFILGTQFDLFDITTYEQFKEAGLYDQGYFKLDAKLGYTYNGSFSAGTGTRFEYTSYNPSLNSTVNFKGSNNFITSYFFINVNTLDRPLYPRNGVKIRAEADWVFPQNPSVQIQSDGRNLDSAGISAEPYQRVLFNLEDYTSISKKTTLMAQVQSGINFNYTTNISNEFSIGGLTEQFHNQTTFAGLREGTLYSPSLAELQVGLRYQIFNNTYLIGRANVLFNNFISTSPFFNNPDFLSGYSLTFAYKFVLGPLELSAMYCDQSKKVIGYVNIGVPF
jgi:NTE family protein